MKVKRVSLEEARQKALPILMSGYEKRNKLRSNAEESIRSPEKIARDRQATERPHLSPI